MSPSPDEFLLLCTRQLSGEASAEERRRLDELLQDPDCRARYDELNARWREWRDSPAPHFDPHRAFERLTAQLPDLAPRAATVHVFPSRRRAAWRWAMATAAAAVLAFTFWQIEARRPAETPVAWMERKAAAGETPQIVLADGSRVTLNGQSTLFFPAVFGAARTVRLQGEACFEVAHDAAHPFVVEAGDWKTTVLGTKFNVSVLPENRGARIALLEGRVAIEPVVERTGVSQVILRPGQQFSVGKETGLGHVEAFAADEAVGWMTGVLAFRDEPLAVVAARLERKFGVAFEFTTVDLRGKAISARFEKESLTEILEILSFAGSIRCEKIVENGAITRVRLWPTQVGAASH